jgi:CubicO group peptidase (beta-lactamase class C family)
MALHQTTAWRHRRTATVLAVLACLLAAPVSAQPAASRFDAIVEIAKRELADTRTPGGAIALIDGDRVVFSAGVGVADVESGVPVRPEMLFRLGSTTKMFTAAALVSLADEKGLALDRPIGSVVPGLHASIAALTPHQLLSHTAGLRDEAPMFGRQDDSALGDGVRAMNAGMLFTSPAAIYSYSNPGYWISGHVIEQLSGKAYADALQERLFAPLGMARSTFRPTLAMTYPIAQGHDATGTSAPTVIRPAANNTATWPAGSLFSNVTDLSRFVIAFMNEGRLDGRDVLKPVVIKKLSSAQAPNPGGAASYGYGLQLSEAGGVALVSHGGSRAGYGSTISMVPSRRVAAIAVGNRSGSGLPVTTRRAVEMLLGLADGALRPPQPATHAAAGVDGWAGRYSQGSGTGIEIAVKEGRVVVRENGRDQPATPLAGLRLAVGDAAAPQWVLVPGRDGQPEYLFRGGRAFKRVP